MKKILLLTSFSLVATLGSAQMVNNGQIFVSSGAVVSFDQKIENNGEIINNGALTLKNDLENNGKFSSKGSVKIGGRGVQTINGKNISEFADLNISNDLNLKSDISVSNNLEFNNGLISTFNNSGVNLGEKATHSGASDFSHVNGLMRRSGDGSFDFPVGDEAALKTFSTSNDKNGTLAVQYFAKNPYSVSSEIDADLAEINSNEYWSIKSNDNSMVTSVNMANSQMASLKSGVWQKESNKISNLNNGLLVTSAKEKDGAKSIGIWPNPSKGEFNLKLTGLKDENQVTVEVITETGVNVMQLSGKVKELRKAYTLPANLAASSLTVRVNNGTETLTQKLVLLK